MEAIVTHSSGDFDSIASVVAAKKIYPKAYMIIPQSLEKQVRKFLSLYQDFFDFKDERHFNFGKVNKLIIVDTRLKSRIGRAESILDKKNLEIHIYDHHPRTEYDLEADREISRQIGAAVTILIDEIKKRKVKITPIEATIMSLGIYEDTGSLTFRTTTKEDIDALSFLMSQGANLNIVSHYLNRELTEEELSILVRLIQNTRAHLINGVHVAICTASYDRYIADLALLTHRLIEIENFNVIFVLVKIDSKIQMIARSSLPSVDVNRITSFFGGGGHSSAASCVIRGETLKNAKEKLIKTLKMTIKPEILAQDIMSKEFKTTTDYETINKVKTDMIKYNIGEMLILKKGKLVGIVTRADLDKAIYHGLGHSKTTGYMTRDVICVSQEAPLSNIKRIFFENNIGRVPVLKNNKIVGLIRRNDILGIKPKKLNLSSSTSLLDKYSQESIESVFVNLTDKMKKRVPVKIFGLLKKIGKIADEYEFRIYVVGGFVRDLILNYKNLDVDLAIEGQAIKFAEILSRKFKAKLIIHKRFGTAVLVLPDKFKIDLATSRTEFYEYPAALPTVELGSIKKDLSRRDFTINAMAIGLNKDNFGLLIDFFGGLKDIKDKKIKVLHNLSFVEDPTRIFRAVRFEQRYGFKIDRNTEHLIKTAVDMHMFEKIAGERIRDEIIPILSEPEPLRGIKRMHQLHELRFIHPKIDLTKTVLSYFKNIKKNLSYIKRYLNKPLSVWLVYFFALCEDLSLKQLMKVIKRFILSKKDSEKLVSYKKNNKAVLKKLRISKRLPVSYLYRLLQPYSFEFIVMILSRTSSKIARERIKNYLKKYKDVNLKISGNDLKKIGLKPSLRFKFLLNKVLYAKLDKGFKTKQQELDYLKILLKK